MKSALGVMMLMLASALGGCMSPPAPPTSRPEVTFGDRGRLWEATRDVVEKHFDLYIQREDVGYMASTYKIAQPLPDFWNADAQNDYDWLEDLLSIVRRRLFARILPTDNGRFRLYLEIKRERQGYVPPPTWYSSSYDLFDPLVTPLNDVADQGPTVTWYPLGRDWWLENALLKQINDELMHPE